MAIGSVTSIVSTATPLLKAPVTRTPTQTLSAAQSAQQEASESPAVTRQEANKGDQVAVRKLAKEESSESPSQENLEGESKASNNNAAALLQGKGSELNTVA